MSMSEVEALLSVDAGRVPPGAVVFVAADPEAPARRMHAFLAIVAAASAIGCAWNGVGSEPVALLALVAGILGVLAFPSDPEPEDAHHKPATLVVTLQGMIVRDAGGLRTWRFDELADVRPYVHPAGDGLLLVKHDGSRAFLDCLTFRRGETLGEVIGRRLKPRST
jgi:hypothetical protein